MKALDLNLLQQRYVLLPLEPGEFGAFNLAGMDFRVSAYEANGLGRVSVLEASGMGGAMQMTSLIVNPVQVDGPLFSLDSILLPDKQMLHMELYDTLLTEPRQEAPFAAIAAEYGDIMDLPNKPCWYDSIRYKASVGKAAPASQQQRMQELMDRYFGAYVEQLSKAPASDPARKKPLADRYRDGLLDNGGPATDAFLKAWGREKTAQLFEKVLFG